jgi:hypothetical protein
MAPPLLVLSAIESNNRAVAIKGSQVQKNSSTVSAIASGCRQYRTQGPLNILRFYTVFSGRKLRGSGIYIL